MWYVQFLLIEISNFKLLSSELNWCKCTNNCQMWNYNLTKTFLTKLCFKEMSNDHCNWMNWINLMVKWWNTRCDWFDFGVVVQIVEYCCWIRFEEDKIPLLMAERRNYPLTSHLQYLGTPLPTFRKQFDSKRICFCRRKNDVWAKIWRFEAKFSKKCRAKQILAKITSQPQRYHRDQT